MDDPGLIVLLNQMQPQPPRPIAAAVFVCSRFLDTDASFHTRCNLLNQLADTDPVPAANAIDAAALASCATRSGALRPGACVEKRIGQGRTEIGRETFLEHPRPITVKTVNVAPAPPPPISRQWTPLGEPLAAGLGPSVPELTLGRPPRAPRPGDR